ncbi:hypothetical protein AVEN_78612-1 [Araneus ventricosus]|uniref:Uncharacterized protein n=1 Tax=Araneus ventricosus TaxID=182803 RepID=A0A4Y2FZD4_ARAVE|nr:hypothetical protein AVEN_78612-1 [Araneus ventricosus]
MKVLGIFFPANLSFNFHFNYVAKNALKRLGCLRALSGCNWGANTVHQLKLANACIRSICEFGAQVTSYAGSTSWRKLEVVHHNCLRFAARLPHWTPNPVMFSETGEIRLRDRCLALSTSFLLRHFALGDKFSPIKKSNLCTLDGLRPSFKEWFSGGTNWLKFLKDANVSIENFIPFVYPVELHKENTVRIHMNCLPFQQSQILSPTICKLFDEYDNKEWNSSILIFTDRSKGEESVSLAALNITYNRTLTLKLHPKNSVFTAGCAILIAIERLTGIFWYLRLHNYKPYPDRTEAGNQPISLATRGSDVIFSSRT